MMDESARLAEVSSRLFDLESMDLDFTDVSISSQGDGEYSFTVPTQAIGRKIGYEIGKRFNMHPFRTNQLEADEVLDNLELAQHLSFTETVDSDQFVARVQLLDDTPYSKPIAKLHRVVQEMQEDGYDQLTNMQNFLAILQELKRSGIFNNMRGEIQGGGTYFDPSSDILVYQDRRDTGIILNQFQAALVNNDPIATKRLTNQLKIQDLIDALEPDSIKRRVLLAYWNTTEETPWNTTSGQIATEQAHNRDRFPKDSDVRNVISNL